MTMELDMIGFKGIATVEIAILLILTGWLSYTAITKKEAILSTRGREIVNGNLPTIKLGVLFSLVSMLFFLEAETAEIISILFPSAFTIDLVLIQGYGEVLHLFLLILALLFFLSVLTKAGEGGG